MGMRIYADDSAPIPRPIFIDVSCDRSHGLLPSPTVTFSVVNQHPRDPVTAAGWKITPDGEVICPECR